MFPGAAGSRTTEVLVSEFISGDSLENGVIEVCADADSGVYMIPQ